MLRDLTRGPRGPGNLTQQGMQWRPRQPMQILQILAAGPLADVDGLAVLHTRSLSQQQDRSGVARQQHQPVKPWTECRARLCLARISAKPSATETNSPPPETFSWAESPFEHRAHPPARKRVPPVKKHPVDLIRAQPRRGQRLVQPRRPSCANLRRSMLRSRGGAMLCFDGEVIMGKSAAPPFRSSRVQSSPRLPPGKAGSRDSSSISLMRIRSLCRMGAGGGNLLDLPQGARRAHQRQPVPMCEA